MSRLLIFLALGMLHSCATSHPPMPAFWTDGGKACGLECQAQYSACMKNEVRPDFLLLSPRKDACERMLRVCYDTCSRKEKGN